MQLNTLKSAPGAVQHKKCIGRGQGSGKGGTATRGHKGAQSRSGYKRKRGFEGGQLPLQRRIPRYGFKNPNRFSYKPINLGVLQRLVEKEALVVIDAAVLVQHGLIGKHDHYKVLSHGTLQSKINVCAPAFSASARAAIEKLGGQATIVNSHA
ncbi:MAG: 50S ribosomal protein L15 [Bacteroidota bacterium]